MKTRHSLLSMIMVLLSVAQLTSCKSDDDLSPEPQKKDIYVSTSAANDSIVGLYIDTLKVETHKYLTTLKLEKNHDMTITIYNDVDNDKKAESFEFLGNWRLLEEYQEHINGFTFIAMELTLDLAKIIPEEYMDSLKDTGVQLAVSDTCLVAFSQEKLLGMITNESIQQIQQKQPARIGALLTQSARTRGFWSWVKENIVDTAINPFITLAKTTAETFNTWRYRLENWTGSENVETPPVYADWMKHIDDATPVSYITMPGTHDSFTKTVSFPACQYAQTQDFELDGLWARGCRQFDIRLRYNGSTLVDNNENNFEIVHGSGTFCCSCNLNLKQAIDKIHQQLKSHPTETAIVIVKFDETRDFDYAYEHLQEYLWTRFDTITATFRPDMTMKDARGKIIFISRASKTTSNDPELHRYSIPSIKIPTNGGWGDNNLNQSLYAYDHTYSNDYVKAQLIVQDKYEMKWYQTLEGWLDQKKASMNECFSLAASHPQAWVFNHTSAYTIATVSNLITGNVMSLLGAGMSYSQNAYYINDYANDCVIKSAGKHIGIIPMDWLGTSAPCYGHSPRCMELPINLILHNKTLKFNGKNIWKD